MGTRVFKVILVINFYRQNKFVLRVRHPHSSQIFMLRAFIKGLMLQQSAPMKSVWHKNCIIICMDISALGAILKFRKSRKGS